MNKVYRMITDRVITLLEQGVVPWRKPWKGEDHRPRNLVSQRSYRGINSALLACAPYTSPWWVTYRQAKRLEGNVRRAEKGFPVVFWKWIERKAENEDGEQELQRFPFLRYYTVFNVEQCDGLDCEVPEPEHTSSFTPIEKAESIVKQMPGRPKIGHGKPEACYTPSKDAINMPKPELFTPPEASVNS